MERLQRILAARGIASRRAAEELITAGRVSVDGVIITELGAKADPERSVILVDGNPIKKPRPRYIILNKPSGYITTTKDERDRWTVMKLINVTERVYPVGRLDRDTEGVLLFTNDGDVANRVMHPRYGLAKEYHVLTLSRPSQATLQRLRDGIVIDGKTIVPKEIRILRETREGLIITVTVHEGVYHLVRRMMETVGIPIARLRRVRVGPLGLASLAVGESRDLTMGEVATLMEALHIDDDGERTLSGPTQHRPGARKARPLPDASAPPPVRRRDEKQRHQPRVKREQRPADRDQTPRDDRQTGEAPQSRPAVDYRPTYDPFPNRAPVNRDGQPRDDRNRGGQPFAARQEFSRDSRPQGDERNQGRPPMPERGRSDSDDRPRADRPHDDRNQGRSPLPDRQRFERDDRHQNPRPFPPRQPFEPDDRPRQDDENPAPRPYPARGQFNRDMESTDGGGYRGRRPAPTRGPINRNGQSRSGNGNQGRPPVTNRPPFDPDAPRPVRSADDDGNASDRDRTPFNDQRGRHQNYNQARDERAEPKKGSDADGAPARPDNDRPRPRPTSPDRDRRTGGGGKNNRRTGASRPGRRDLS